MSSDRDEALRSAALLATRIDGGGVSPVDDAPEASKASHTSRFSEGRWLHAAQFLVAAAFLVLWQVVGSQPSVIFYTSTPLKVLAQIAVWSDQGVLWPGLRATVTAAIVGFAIGATFGAVLGFAFGWIRLLGRILEPFVILLYSVPKITLGPLFVIFFGIGISTKIALAALVVFFLVFFTTFQGVRQVDEELIAISRVLGANRWQALTKIGLPSSTVWIFAGFKIALPNALIGAVVGEFLAATEGIGFLINNASSELNTSGVFAGVLLLVVASAVLTLILKLVEDYVLAWQRAGRSHESIASRDHW